MAVAKSEACCSQRSPTPLVYLHGCDNEAEKWYCIDVDKLEMNSSSTTTTICPVVRIDDEYGGGWDCIDGYIYSAGGRQQNNVDSMHLLRCKTGTGTGDCNANWEVVSSTERLCKQCARPFVAAVDNNLYVLSGFRPRPIPFEESSYELSSGLPRPCGEIYNLITKTWTSLTCDLNVNAGDPYEPIGYQRIFLLENEGEPTCIGFICFIKGYIRFYNVTTQEWFIQDHPFLALYPPSEEGLKACVNFDVLARVVFGHPPVVNNSTLYWFTPDLFLYGYDLAQKRWFQSKQLDKELSREPPCFCSYSIPLISVLVYLCNDLFLLIAVGNGKLEMATLEVSKDDKADIYTLSVIVKQLPSLFTNPSFLPTWAKVMPVSVKDIGDGFHVILKRPAGDNIGLSKLVKKWKPSQKHVHGSKSVFNG